MSETVLVLGATGVVGRGVVEAAVEAGRRVIAVARGRDALEALRRDHAGAGIDLVPGSVANEADAAALARRLRDLDRPITGVAAAVAGVPRRGRILDNDGGPDAMRAALDEDLLPHVAAARHLLPLMAERGRGGTWLLIGGPAGALPWAGYGHRSVAAAAVRMLACALHDEARCLGVRAQLLAVESPVCRPGAKACPQWPTALEIGRRAMAMLERSDPGVAARPIVPYGARTPSLPLLSTNPDEVFPHAP
jgi:NAD(P)-dependent dehydrogenase (short-subunit alcohol dehydrogenase family)